MSKAKNDMQEAEEKAEEVNAGDADAQEEAEAAQEEADPKDAEIERLKDQLMRSMAEYDNYRKRTSRERMELEPEITAKTVAEFLTVKDNLERALNAECSDQGFKKGVEMIYDSFNEALEKLGVTEIPADGEFDPSMHQAVQQVPAEEGQESGQIASTFQKGYKIGEKVLRFAMVAVYQ